MTLGRYRTRTFSDILLGAQDYTRLFLMRTNELCWPDLNISQYHTLVTLIDGPPRLLILEICSHPPRSLLAPPPSIKIDIFEYEHF